MSESADQEEAFRALVRRKATTRDVVFFYHQQADYDFVMDDLTYAAFATRWWEYLADDERDEHIERGCLALAFAAGSHDAANVGRALGDDLPACRAAVAAFAPSTAELARLRQAAITALDLAAIPDHRRDFEQVEALAVEGEWVHAVTVRRYFVSTAARWRG